MCTVTPLDGDHYHKTGGVPVWGCSCSKDDSVSAHIKGSQLLGSPILHCVPTLFTSITGKENGNYYIVLVLSGQGPRASELTACF